MSLTCPRCRRTLESTTFQPSFCAFCGQPLLEPALDATEEFRPDSASATVAIPPGAGGRTAEHEPELVAGYHLIRPLGSGGMGTVFEAEEPGTGRKVALKLISSEFAGSPEAVERFRQEGRLAAAIAHPRCVFVFAADEEAGRPYIVMEQMPGTTLRDLVQENGPLDTVDAVRKILDVIDGLREAHRLGVIHRDVKPSNCFLEARGRVKIGDFGLSRSLEADSRLTRTGMFLGTPLYASPEQIRRDPIDERTDVYSVAATLYYVLTGAAPFEHGDATAAMARIVSEPAPPLRPRRRGIPKTLERVVLRGLERDRDRRWHDLDEFRAALLPFVPEPLSLQGIGTRMLAYLIDVLLYALVVYIPFGAITVFIIQTAGGGGQLVLRPGDPINTLFGVLEALGWGLWFVYFGLGDGLRGGTAGKRLLRLRVCTTRGGPAGIGRGLVRTLVFVGMFDLWRIFELLGFTTRFARPGNKMWILDLLIHYLWYPLLFITARPANGYRGLHEFLSGTRVVQTGTRPEPVKRRRREVDSLVELSRPEGLPARVGPFLVRGALCWNEDLSILEGEDSALKRSVWIVRQPSTAPAWPAARHAVDRITRLRWIGGGVGEDGRWEALIAPSGRRLVECVSRRSPLPWHEARPILHALAEELEAAGQEGTLPEDLTLDQVWLRPDGQVLLLDVPRDPSAGPTKAESHLPPQERALDLLRAVTIVMLEGVPRPLDNPRHVRAVMPCSAAALLDRLMGTSTGAPSLPEFLDEMRRIESDRAELGRGQQFVWIASFLIGTWVEMVLPAVVLVIFLTRKAGVGSEQLYELDLDLYPFNSIVAIAGLVMFLWAFFSRGGLLRHLLEADFVRLDGRPSSRLRCALREAMLWGPFILLVFSRIAIAARFPLGITTATAIDWAIMLLFPLVYAAHGLFFRGRLLQDRLAGTVLVPK
jgi:uncharacterized RDD family membrane protein YckC